MENELSDPTNPLLRKEKEAGNADPGELIRSMVDVKRRIEKISKAKEGRGKLVSQMLGESDAEDAEEPGVAPEKEAVSKAQLVPPKSKTPEARDIAEMDKRVGELEKLVGSSSTALDEVRHVYADYMRC